MEKTFAELKRDIAKGLLWGEMVERNGSTEIPEHLKGVRKIVRANSAGIRFINADGKESECRIKRAALCSYTGSELTVYNYGERDLTVAEQKVMDGWKDITSTESYRQQAEVDALSDGSSTYWKGVAYFEKAGMPYLYHYDMAKYGKEYNHKTGKVWDMTVRGEPCLKYKIYCRKEEA